MAATGTRIAEFQPLLVPVDEEEGKRTRVAVATADRESHAEISSCLAMFHEVVLVDSAGGTLQGNSSEFRDVDVFVSTYGEIEESEQALALPHFPDARLIVVGPRPDGATLVTAARNGAWAYFGLDEPPQEFNAVIQRVSAGEAPLLEAISANTEAASIALRLLSIGPEAALRASPTPNPLNEREAEILTAVADGANSDEIAERLNLSSQTVRNQMSPILQKLGARTRGHAAAIAVRNGWVEGD